MGNENKKSRFNMSFNSLEVNKNDPTLIEATMIVHDFEVSENKQCITEEICADNMSTLIGKRIVCNYISAQDNNGLDALTDHEDKLTKDREGNDLIITDTIAVGFINSVYIDDYTDSNGNTKRVLFAKATLWNDDKYAEILKLLKEWIGKGIKINMSVEYLYCNYSFNNGVEYIQSPIIYTGHCILNSEDRNDYLAVEPAYNIAELVGFESIQSWNKAINNIKSLNQKEELEQMEKKNVMFEYLKSINALSCSDYRYRIYSALEKVMIAEEYNTMYIYNSDIYPIENYFMYRLDKYDSETQKWIEKIYKVTFAVDENDNLSVDYEGKTEIEYQGGYVEIQKSLNEKIKENEILTKELENIKASLNTKEDDLIKSNNSKKEVDTKLDKANEMVISLNTKVDELNKQIETMQPIVDEYNKAEFEKAFNSLHETYKKKFEKVGALNIFEEESTQEILKKSVNATSNEFKSQLNQLIVDNMNIEVEDVKEDNTDLKSINSIVKSKETKELTNEFTDIYEEMSGIKVK